MKSLSQDEKARQPFSPVGKKKKGGGALDRSRKRRGVLFKI